MLNKLLKHFNPHTLGNNDYDDFGGDRKKKTLESKKIQMRKKHSQEHDNPLKTISVIQRKKYHKKITKYFKRKKKIFP